jgi:methylenetetrahydrofolate--tRNA-(uracil-5-)-methyltransferase
MQTLTVIGGGLAGCEAAWQAAQRGVAVRLLEMRPLQTTGAHRSGDLAELVCSNSLGTTLPDRAGGILKRELEGLDSLLLMCARATAVPAGSALAVDRAAFAESVTEKILSHPRIELVRAEATAVPDGPAVIATGPLTSAAFSDALQSLAGTEHLYFYDAVAPVLTADSVDRTVVFSDARNDLSADYLNCALTEAEYRGWVEELIRAERAPLREFETEVRAGVRAGMDPFFEGCLPIEVVAERGRNSLAYGTLRPVGLRDPRTGERPYAAVQLRREDAAQTLYNLVGFQTNLKEGEQRRVFRMIPGLEKAEFVRYGQMHRNTYLNAPRLLLPTLQFRGRPDLFCAGQLTGVEGYAGNIATGLIAGWNAARFLRGEVPLEPPAGTLIGGLCAYITGADPAHFQPMKANLGLLPAPGKHPGGKRGRSHVQSEQERTAFSDWLARTAID